MPPRRDPATETSPSDALITSLADSVNKLLQATTATNSLVHSSQDQTKAQLDIIMKQLAIQYEQTNNMLAAFCRPDPNRPSSSGSNPPPTPPPTPPLNQPRPPKIHLPTFDGSNPLDWIFQAENYFNYYQIPSQQRVALVVFYFIGDALSWYKHLANNRSLGSWQEFSRSMELRFGPSTYENHQAALFKLQQTSSVSAYQTEFERLSNRVIGLSSESLLNCYLSGLKPEIQNELAILKPTSLKQANGLAKLVEDKLTSRDSPKPVSPPTSTPLELSNSNSLKRLTSAEMQAKKAAGICFSCDEKFQPGHRCKTPQFLLFESPQEPPWDVLKKTVTGHEDMTHFKGAGIDTDPS